jgi:hypothetical protein
MLVEGMAVITQIVDAPMAEQVFLAWRPVMDVELVQQVI